MAHSANKAEITERRTDHCSWSGSVPDSQHTTQSSHQSSSAPCSDCRGCKSWGRRARSLGEEAGHNDETTPVFGVPSNKSEKAQQTTGKSRKVLDMLRTRTLAERLPEDSRCISWAEPGKQSAARFKGQNPAVPLLSRPHQTPLRVNTTNNEKGLFVKG